MSHSSRRQTAKVELFAEALCLVRGEQYEPSLIADGYRFEVHPVVQGDDLALLLKRAESFVEPLAGFVVPDVFPGGAFTVTFSAGEKGPGTAGFIRQAGELFLALSAVS